MFILKYPLPLLPSGDAGELDISTSILKRMEGTNLIQRANALSIGNLGGMMVYISRNEIPEWPKGAIGLVLGINPFIIFPAEVLWTRNPKAHDKRVHFLVGDINFPNYRDHMKESFRLKRMFKFSDPMYGYFIINYLFRDGYSLVRHLNWASYFMDRVATFLASPRVQLELNKSLKEEEENELVHIRQDFRDY